MSRRLRAWRLSLRSFRWQRLIAFIAALAAGWAIGIASAQFVSGGGFQPEFIAALAGALVGGLVSLAATETQVRASRDSRLSDYRWDAYLAFLKWHRSMIEGLENPWDGNRSVADWDAQEVEQRAYIFGSAIVREGLGVLITLRDHAHWWDKQEGARTTVADLVNQIRVAMEHEMRGDTVTLRSSIDHTAKLWKEFPEPFHPDW